MAGHQQASLYFRRTSIATCAPTRILGPSIYWWMSCINLQASHAHVLWVHSSNRLFRQVCASAEGLTVAMAAFQVKGKWRAQYARYGNKGIVVLAILMAVTGVALILAGMQQPKAPVILPGGGTGPSRNEVRAGALQEARKVAKQKSSLTSGCPMLKVPKVRMQPQMHECPVKPRHSWPSFNPVRLACLPGSLKLHVCIWHMQRC